MVDVRTWSEKNLRHDRNGPPYEKGDVYMYHSDMYPKHSQVINIFGCFVYVSIKVFVVSYLKHVVAGW